MWQRLWRYWGSERRKFSHAYGSLFYDQFLNRYMWQRWFNYLLKTSYTYCTIFLEKKNWEWEPAMEEAYNVTCSVHFVEPVTAEMARMVLYFHTSRTRISLETELPAHVSSLSCLHFSPFWYFSPVMCFLSNIYYRKYNILYAKGAGVTTNNSRSTPLLLRTSTMPILTFGRLIQDYVIVDFPIFH